MTGTDDTDARKRLVELLAAAETAMGDPSIDDAWSSLTVGQFRRLLADCRTALTEDSLSHSLAWDVWSAFAPTCDWDDLGGDPGLGDEIYELLESLYGRPSDGG